LTPKAVSFLDNARMMTGMNATHTELMIVFASAEVKSKGDFPIANAAVNVVAKSD